MPKTQKQHLGAKAEDAAAEYLKKRGYKILERNFRRKWGELDIVAKTGKTLVFVEVKALKSSPTEMRPEDHMTRQKLHKFRRACDLYLLERPLGENETCRMDVVAIEIGLNGEIRDLRHIEGIEA